MPHIYIYKYSMCLSMSGVHILRFKRMLDPPGMVPKLSFCFVFFRDGRKSRSRVRSAMSTLCTPKETASSPRYCSTILGCQGQLPLCGHPLSITSPDTIRAAGICINLAGHHVVALRGGHIAHRSTRSTGCTDPHIWAWKRRRRIACREGFFPAFPATRPRFQGDHQIQPFGQALQHHPISQKATQKNIPNRVKLRQKRFTALHLGKLHKCTCCVLHSMASHYKSASMK